MSRWREFAAQLPTIDDAVDGKVVALMTDGTERTAMWNWIQPDHTQARELWHVNGFVAWRRILPGAKLPNEGERDE